MIRNKILGTKVNIPALSPWNALSVAVPTNMEDVQFAPGDILLAKDLLDLVQTQIGNPEEFQFTLEDGTVITKTIRVMNSTTETPNT